MVTSENPGGDDEQRDERHQDADQSASIPPPAADDTLNLSDGRSLGYAEYGPADGDPLVFCHGTPGSRYTRHPDTALLEEHGVRQVTLERPGYGRSTYQPGRELLDWPHDVREAADALGFDQFAVAGFSGGGPHALVCAARLPERVTSAVVINGIGPVHPPGATDGLTLKNRLQLRLVGLPLVPKLMFWPLARKIRTDTDAAIDTFGDTFADVDAQVLRRPDVRAMFHQDFSAAVEQGTRGYARDARILTHPWGFDLAEVPVPVDLWHGELDENVPIPMARFVADELPSCTHHIYSSEGHLLMFDYVQEMLSALTGSAHSQQDSVA